MDARILLALLVQSLILLPGVGPDEADEATRQRMKERAEMLSRETTRLLQELEQHSQSSPAWGALRLAASQHWHVWATAAVLLLLFALCWWLCKRCSRNNVDLERQEEQPGIALDADRASCTPCTPVPPEVITSLHEVMSDLLHLCLKRSRKGFFPVLHTPVIMTCNTEVHGPLQYEGVYDLLVPVKAPRGHSFHLERCTTGNVRSKRSRIRVELKCTCEKQPPDGDMLCFLHHPKEELRRKQAPSLLDTLCTGSYLDVEKTDRWFRRLVYSSWRDLSDKKGCELSVGTCPPFCQLELHWSSYVLLLADMTWVVKEDDSDRGGSIDW